MTTPTPGPPVPEPPARATPPADPPHRAPRWVRVTLAVVGLLVLLLVVARLTGIGGEHGPGRHLSGPAPAGDAVVRLDPSWTPAG